MRKEKFPLLLFLLAILIGAGGLTAIILNTLDFGFTYKTIFVVFGWLVMTGMIILMFFGFNKRYQDSRKLLIECTKSDIGIVKETGLSAINTGNTNPAFITIEFNGFNKTFCYVTNELRFKYKHDDDINILYNPKNKQEFIF